MKKSTSYYTKGFRRKMLAQAFYRGLIATDGQEKVIRELLGGVDQEIKIKFSEEYRALKYLDSSYKDLLEFKDGIAISEKGGDVTPLIPALYALHVFNEGEMELFDKQVAYLESKVVKKGDACCWYYEAGVERFGLEGPWVSGISQGVIASVFIRKYKVSGGKRYLDLAKGAIAYCLDKGNGLLTETDNGYWVEEYPAGDGKGVLNGFMFFLIALGELASMEYFVEEFKQGINTLITELPSFHKGVYILYGKHISDLGNGMYDTIHYYQLDALHKLTSIGGFYSLKDYWRRTSVSNLS